MRSKDPIAVLLLPRTLEQFILREQAEDLLRADGVVAIEPGRTPYGAYGRMPEAAADRMARGQAKRMVSRLPGRCAVVVMFHPLQWPLARELLRRSPGAELWYGRWDRYEEAYDAGPGLRARLTAFHEAAAEAASLVFVASGKLAEIEEAAGRSAELVGLAAGAFPAPSVSESNVVAISLGHLGWRTDWALLRRVSERLGDRLVLLLVGAWHEDEVGADEDFAWCRSAGNLVWLGSQPDEVAARLIAASDVGIVPFERSEFNEAGLPYRILKYAKLGRRTVCPDIAGARTWERAVTFATDADAFADALLASAGARMTPDLELRDWALEQTATKVNEPLWTRLAGLGIHP